MKSKEPSVDLCNKTFIETDLGKGVKSFLKLWMSIGAQWAPAKLSSSVTDQGHDPEPNGHANISPPQGRKNQKYTINQDFRVEWLDGGQAVKNIWLWEHEGKTTLVWRDRIEPFGINKYYIWRGSRDC